MKEYDNTTRKKDKHMSKNIHKNLANAKLVRKLATRDEFYTTQ